MISYVTGFMFDNYKQHVALVTKNKPAWQAGHLNGIGGKIEPGETPLQAMIREFEEETGVNHRIWLPVVRIHSASNDYEVYFYATFTDKIAYVRTVESEEIHTYAVSTVLSGALRIIPNLAWLIPLALDPLASRNNFIEVPLV